MIKYLLILLIPIVLLSNDDRPPIKYDFLKLKQTNRFINKMVSKYHFKKSYMVAMMRDAKLDRDTLDRYRGRYRAGTTVGTWERFKDHVLDRYTLTKAKKFKSKYKKILNRASKEYRVPSEYIVGFIAVESKLGENTGDYRLLDSLSTLAFHSNRMQKFFYNELVNFFLMSREQRYDPRKVEGSFAGALGCVQQMPSVYRRYGMDYNKDGKKNPWDMEDCIGVIARFMHQKGWNNGSQVAIKARYKGKRFTTLRSGYKRVYPLSTLKKYGVTPISKFYESKASLLKLRNNTHDELWLGAKNFKILMRYNPNSNYGMAIHKIAEYVK